MPGARARHRATPPPSLLAWSLLVALERRTKPRSPPVPSHSPPILPLLSLALSLSRVRTRRSPPFAIAIATGLPSPPRHASELRHNPLHLLVELRTSRTCCNATTIAVSVAGHRSSSPSIRELPDVPDLALTLVGLAVSSSTDSPYSHAH